LLQVLNLSSDEEAVDIAPHSLVGGVFTPDLKGPVAGTRQLRAGQGFVNEWYTGRVETPFCGYGKPDYAID
jgi:aldehyde dehydrogenase (NAD+)